MKHAASPAPHPAHADARTNVHQADDFSTRLRIYRDIADVTWRMFVPSIGGCVLGVIADRIWHTKPWCTVAGVVVGFVVVGFLVAQQIRRTARSAA